MLLTVTELALMTHFNVPPPSWNLLERTEEYHDARSGWVVSK